MGIFSRGRRKTLVVDKQYQYKTTIIGIVYILAAAFCLSLPIINLMRAMNLLLQSHSAGMVDMYKTQQQYTIMAMIGFFAGLLALWTGFTIWRTHRVAGPVVKISRHIHEFATGDFSGRIRLRSKDELQALAESFNKMADSLQEREQAIQLRIREGIENARGQAKNSTSGETLDRIADEVTRAFQDHRPPEPAAEAEPAPEDLVTTESV
jgi:nitrogen fixation/metabolism regulation signal transduction histidine kinase